MVVVPSALVKQIMETCHLDRQTDTTVSNPVICPKLRVARFISAFWQSYEIELTQKEALLEQRYFTGSIPLLNPNHYSLRTCGGAEAFISTTIFMKCGEKTNSGGQEGYIMRTH